MSQHIITGKQGAKSVAGVTAPVLYRLSDVWQSYCQALNLEVSGVEALAAQGSVVEAHHRLRRLIAGTDTGASQTTQPLTAPFVSVPQPWQFGQGGAQHHAQRGAAAGAPARSAASGVPTAGLAAAAGALARRGRQVFVVTKYQRFRPLVPSKVVSVRRLHQGLRRCTRGELAICLEEVLPGCFQ